VVHPADGNAMGLYRERYVYDNVGNFLEMEHRSSNPANPGWKRTYAYNEASLLELGKQSNSLSSTSVGNGNLTVEQYAYDAHGNMLRMLQLQAMQWNFQDQLQMTQRQAVNAVDADGMQHQGERTWYVYDSTGQRVRKVTEQASGQLKDERIYLAGFETYRQHSSANGGLVRESLHIMDDKQRIAMVDTRTQGDQPGLPQQFLRYQLGNHLGSASLELDDQARIITYEEYAPYGATSYQGVRSQTETPKRYRQAGKERDDESGLYYHGARYYAPWLGRWTSVDPVYADSPQRSPYAGIGNNPLSLVDLDGRQETAPSPRGFTRMLGPTYPTVAEWQRRALQSAGIDISQWQPGRGFEQNRQIVQRVYAYYTGLFNKDQNLLWAGMAKLAGGEVLRGFERAQQDVDAARFARQHAMWGEPGESAFIASMDLKAGYARTLQDRLLQMQKDIFLDLAWQHQAYVEGGLSALEIARDAGVNVPIEAWRDIASGDPDRVRRGNRELLRREQGTILPPHYAAIRDIPDLDIIPSMMSSMALSPIPGARSFGTVVPNGDITVFRDRWRWIESDMLPAYERLSPERRWQLVNTPLTTLSERRFPSEQLPKPQPQPQLQLQP
jgi:RHS repeat-associated protein